MSDSTEGDKVQSMSSGLAESPLAARYMAIPQVPPFKQYGIAAELEICRMVLDSAIPLPHNQVRSIGKYKSVLWAARADALTLSDDMSLPRPVLCLARPKDVADTPVSRLPRDFGLKVGRQSCIRKLVCSAAFLEIDADEVVDISRDGPTHRYGVLQQLAEAAVLLGRMAKPGEVG